MPDVFDGEPDARQSDDLEMPTSRFRPRYRALGANEKELHDAIKRIAADLERCFEHVEVIRRAWGHDARPREAAIAITKLEEAVMWAVKGLTA